MQAIIDRNPYDHIPPESRKRTEAWAASARNLVSQSLPYLNLAVERLMFAERPILQMEERLAHREGAATVPDEPLLLMECSSLSILWACGLYEVTRLMKASRNPKSSSIADLHKKLASLRMPLAKHEVKGRPHLSHYPTSVWEPESGTVGWSVYNPDTDSFEVHHRARLADEFLLLTGQLSP
jgi:hypothetical protein